MADVLQPIGQRLVAVDLPGVAVVAALGVRRPDQDEHRAGTHEQGMGAVVEVLAAEVPEVQDGPGLIRGQRQRRRADADAVGGIRIRLEPLPAQPPAELGLADPPVAEHDHLHIAQRLRPGSQVCNVGAQAAEAVVASVLGQHLRRDLGEAGLGVDDQSLQSRQRDDGLGEGVELGVIDVQPL